MTKQFYAAPVEHLRLQGDFLAFAIHGTEAEQIRVEVSGTEDYQQSVTVETSASEVSVHAHPRPLLIGQDTSTESSPILVEDRSGRIDLYVPTTVSLTVSCSGGGSGEAKIPLHRAALVLEGAFSLTCSQVRDAEVTVNGAGSVVIKQIDGTCTAVVNGAGHVHLQSGTPDRLHAQVSGPGSFTAAVTAQEADLSMFGSGSITVDAVQGRLVENRLGSGTITVNQQ
ncbi:hypothetical protein CBW65_22950 [Tumebacillus avium]|uniref:Putative auto-transporter adhesin head GIN domain-containing protein n=1 Tax=Tumebacillus avium TaxID=1903704 RepID=A0A1Y0IUS8_9BACL|nr:DUF2807 domain-containing protein [Tumebacillus avium]ARU63546.1 hypothetical protein CBW65_22950 [Tumebacillus avium]